MKLGLNLARINNYHTFRPFNNHIHQAEPWWSGDWKNRKHADSILRSNTTYRSMVTAGGSLYSGEYKFEPGHEDVSIKGDVTVLGDTVLIGNDNVWLEITPSVDLDTNVVIPKLYKVDSDGWSKSFIDFCNLFDEYLPLRTMDICGAYSSTKVLPYSHPHTVINTPAGRGGWFEDTGIRRNQLGLLPGSGELHVSVPLWLAAEPNKFITWLSELVATAPKRKIWVSVASELWNTIMPPTGWLLEIARKLNLNDDPYIANCILALMLTKQLRDILASYKNITVCFEWQNAWPWPFDFKTWGDKGPVSERARELLADIGHVATAPYFAVKPASDTMSEYLRTMKKPLADLSKWKKLCDDLNVKLHIYEAGPENYSRPEFSQTPNMAQACVAYLDQLSSILDDDAFCYWFFACGHNPFGLTSRLDVGAPKLDAILRWFK